MFICSKMIYLLNLIGKVTKKGPLVLSLLYPKIHNRHWLMRKCFLNSELKGHREKIELDL